jgi:predicted RNA methylase
LSLIECGDGFAETKRQLDQWRVPGPIAAEAVNWAWKRHRIAAEHGPEAA